MMIFLVYSCAVFLFVFSSSRLTKCTEEEEVEFVYVFMFEIPSGLTNEVNFAYSCLILKNKRIITEVKVG